jgi:formate hydrogenlyase subunit 6/NADH:ubiquinone oxidoreductase subunit I
MSQPDRRPDLGIVWPAVTLNRQLCVDCGLCTGVCAPRALAMNPADWRLTLDKSACTNCGACAPACPVGAIGGPDHVA